MPETAGAKGLIIPAEVVAKIPFLWSKKVFTFRYWMILSLK